MACAIYHIPDSSRPGKLSATCQFDDTRRRP